MIADWIVWALWAVWVIVVLAWQVPIIIEEIREDS